MKDDDADFREVLFDDVVYIGNGTARRRYSPTSNDALRGVGNEQRRSARALVAHDAVVAERPAFERRPPVSSLRAPPPKLSSSTAPTARCSVSTLLNHMCRDMEQIHDTSRPPDRIRQDVTRSPGGDSSVFNNNCIGCHIGHGLDGAGLRVLRLRRNRGAALVYTQGQVQPKYLINSDNFKPGYVTPDDAWENRMRADRSRNTKPFWSWAPATMTASRQRRRRACGQEFAYSGAFAECQTEKVFRKVCFRGPTDAELHLPRARLRQHRRQSFKNGGEPAEAYSRRWLRSVLAV